MRRFTLPSHKFSEYDGLEKNGFIDDYITNLDNAGRTFNWQKVQKRYSRHQARGSPQHFWPDPKKACVQVRKSIVATFRSPHCRMRHSATPFPLMIQVQGKWRAKPGQVQLQSRHNIPGANSDSCYRCRFLGHRAICCSNLDRRSQRVLGEVHPAEQVAQTVLRTENPLTGQSDHRLHRPASRCQQCIRTHPGKLR